MKKTTRIIFYILGGVLLFVYALLNTNLVFQNDLFYTIKNGENLIRYGFDFLDHSSQFNLPYLYPHYLFDFILYFVFKYFKFYGIYFFQVILFFLLGVCYFKLLKKKTNTTFFSFLITLLFMNFFAPFISARPQLISYFIILFEYYLFEKYEQTQNKKYLFLLPVLSCLLSQFHGAILPFFFCLFMPYIASFFAHYVLKIKIKKTIPDNKIDIKFFICIMLISFLTTLLNPTGIESILYSFKISATSTIDYISEHQASTIKGMPQFYITLFIMLITSVFMNIKCKTSELCLFFGILLMSFVSKRHISFWLLLVVPVFFSNLISSLPRKKVEIHDQFFLKIGRKIVLLVIAVLIFRNLSFFQTINMDSFIPKKEYPVDATNYILEKMKVEEIRLFNHYDFGSYLLLYDILVFMDSRSDLYTKSFNKKVDIFDDYVEIMKNGSKELLEKYEITHALLPKENNLTFLFMERYDIEYEDEYFVIFNIVNEDEV